MKKRRYIIAAVICGLVLLACIIYLLEDFFREKKRQNDMNQFVLDTQTTEVAMPTESEDEGPAIDIPEKILDWDAMKEECADIYCWLYIPGTNIDYPVVQSSEDKEEDYYLRRDLKGQHSTAGCIYSQKINKKDFSDYNTVIYGHNMRNGTMFKELHNFEDEAFFNENRYAFIYMPDGTVNIYEFFAAYEFSDVHILYTYGCSSEESFAGYLDMIASGRTDGSLTGLFNDELEVTKEDKILTLSTCTDYDDSKRWLVQGVKVK